MNRSVDVEDGRSRMTAMEAAGGSPEGGGRRRQSRTLDRAEIEEILRATSWGVIATAIDGEPYAVPIIFGWDGEAFYVINGPGRKIRNMEANPRVCLTIAEVEGKGQRWRSVVVRGTVEFVGIGGLLHAADVVRKQLGDYTPSVRDAAALAKAKVIKLVPEEITGRAVGY